MDLENNKIIIKIGKKIYAFKSSYKTADFFLNNSVDDLTEEMKFILTRRHIINRVIKLIKKEDQEFFIKEKTKFKYTNIPNFSITRI